MFPTCLVVVSQSVNDSRGRGYIMHLAISHIYLYVLIKFGNIGK